MRMPTLSNEQKMRFASLSLRLGLAFVFLYAGISALRSPAAWIAYVPNFIANIFDAKAVLDLISVAQIVLAVWLAWGKWACYAGALAFALLAGISFTNLSSFVITFRDAGLALAAIAVTLLDWPTLPKKN